MKKTGFTTPKNGDININIHNVSPVDNNNQGNKSYNILLSLSLSISLCLTFFLFVVIIYDCISSLLCRYHNIAIASSFNKHACRFINGNRVVIVLELKLQFRQEGRHAWKAI